MGIVSVEVVREYETGPSGAPSRLSDLAPTAFEPGPVTATEAADALATAYAESVVEAPPPASRESTAGERPTLLGGRSGDGPADDSTPSPGSSPFAETIEEALMGDAWLRVCGVDPEISATPAPSPNESDEERLGREWEQLCGLG